MKGPVTLKLAAKKVGHKLYRKLLTRPHRPPSQEQRAQRSLIGAIPCLLGFHSKDYDWTLEFSTGRCYCECTRCKTKIYGRY